MIGEAKEEREKVDYNWINQLYGLGGLIKANEEEIEIYSKILTDDHIYKIYKRQPLTYLVF